MNKIILIGRLVRDPELSYTQGGKAVCKFTLAVDRPYNGESKEADFINIIVWNKAGENAAKYLAKGRQTAVEGRLQIRSYDANDGAKKYVTEVVAYNFEFIEKKGDKTTPVPNAPKDNQASPMESFGAAVPFTEEIPF